MPIDDVVRTDLIKAKLLQCSREKIQGEWLDETWHGKPEAKGAKISKEFFLYLHKSSFLPSRLLRCSYGVPIHRQNTQI